MTFIFARCLCSAAAVTPVKYERDIIRLTSVLMILKNRENNWMEKISLVTPHPSLSIDPLVMWLFIKTRAVSDCLIRPLPASVNALLVNCAQAKNMKVTGMPF